MLAHKLLDHRGRLARDALNIIGPPIVAIGLMEFRQGSQVLQHILGQIAALECLLIKQFPGCPDAPRAEDRKSANEISGRFRRCPHR